MAKRFRVIIDIIMTAALPALMAYELIGGMFHEIAGIVLFALFITHLVLNHRWYKSVGKGKMDAYRIIQTCVNIALIVIMFVLPVSGIMTSKELFTFLPTDAVTSISRIVHMIASYWGFVLMSFHSGTHLKIAGKKGGRGVRVILHIILLAAMGYGMYAFIKRNLYIYMFLQTQFIFFDYSEPIVFFMIDYVAIMALFGGGGYFIRSIRKKST